MASVVGPAQLADDDRDNKEGHAMAVTRKATAKELATLALAKSLAEGDPKAASAALKAGADAEAFWIDGRTRLSGLVGRFGTTAASKAMMNLFAPSSMMPLPSLKSEPSVWTQEFVEFAARRGYKFSGCTTPLAGGNGADLKGLESVKSGVNLISRKWFRGLLDASCKDSEDGKSSVWELRFDADWSQDRRIVGFKLNFRVDGLGWALYKQFEAASPSGKIDWPDSASPYVGSQREWEGEHIVEKRLEWEPYDVDMLVSCLRAGGNPFAMLNGSLLGNPGKRSGTFEYGSAETKAFMDALRDAIGQREGWHLRIKPLLTAAGVAALRAKVALQSATPKAKTPKKSLKARTDIM